MRKRFVIAVVGISLAACSKESTVSEPEIAPTETPELAKSESEPVAADVDPTLIEWIRAEHEGYEEGLVFASGETDLNGDGVAETVVYVGGRFVCGSGGCNAYVLQRDEGGYTKISGHTVSRLPIGAFESSTNGWRDIAITVRAKIDELVVARLPFDGTRYPLNPTTPPSELTQVPFETVIPFLEYEQLRTLR